MLDCGWDAYVVWDLIHLSIRVHTMDRNMVQVFYSFLICIAVDPHHRCCSRHLHSSCLCLCSAIVVSWNAFRRAIVRCAAAHCSGRDHHTTFADAICHNRCRLVHHTNLHCLDWSDTIDRQIQFPFLPQSFHRQLIHRCSNRPCVPFCAYVAFQAIHHCVGCSASLSPVFGLWL